MHKKIIYGCDSRGDAESPYLTRYELLRCKLGCVYLHVFHRSDAEDMHDHPWNFISVILWRGYIEDVMYSYRETLVVYDNFAPDARLLDYKRTRKKRIWPGMILFRKATHIHRVILVNEKPAVTLVFRGPNVREWGFIEAHRTLWKTWRDYFREKGC